MRSRKVTQTCSIDVASGIILHYGPRCCTQDYLCFSNSWVVDHPSHVDFGVRYAWVGGVTLSLALHYFLARVSERGGFPPELSAQCETLNDDSCNYVMHISTRITACAIRLSSYTRPTRHTAALPSLLWWALSAAVLTSMPPAFIHLLLLTVAGHQPAEHCK